MLSSIPVFSSPKKRTISENKKCFCFPTMEIHLSILILTISELAWLFSYITGQEVRIRRWEYNVRIPGGYLERKTQVILTFWVKTKRQDPDTKKSKVTIKRQKLSLVSDLCCLLWKVFARGWEPKRADATLVLIKMDKKGAFGKRTYFQIFVKQFY